MLKPVFDMTWSKIDDWSASRRGHGQKAWCYFYRLSEIGKRSTLTTANLSVVSWIV